MATELLPTKITLTDWLEDYDLRRLRRDALAICAENKLKPGEAVLVSGSKYKGGRRYQFVIKTAGSAIVAAPPTGSEDMMLSLMLRASEYIAQNFK